MLSLIQIMMLFPFISFWFASINSLNINQINSLSLSSNPRIFPENAGIDREPIALSIDTLSISIKFNYTSSFYFNLLSNAFLICVFTSRFEADCFRLLGKTAWIINSQGKFLAFVTIAELDFIELWFIIHFWQSSIKLY